MEQTITALGKTGFDAVYVANDGMAGGAIAAMKSAGIKPAQFFVTGQDAEVTACSASSRASSSRPSTSR